MHIVLTLFRGEFWVPAARSASQRVASKYAEIVNNARGEQIRIVTESAWDKECVEREKVWRQQRQAA
jgi:hypothetical protein